MRYVNDELKQGEKFVFNMPTDTDLAAEWPGLKTIRLGGVALDIDGQKIDPAYMRPVFVHESELDKLNRIWGRRLGWE
jgi:hypothetical protein